MECPKCNKEITEVDYYKYHLRCKDCWNAYCKTKRYYNKDVQQKAYEKYKLNKVRLCKKCGEKKLGDKFEPNKKFCKECCISASEIKKLYAQSEIAKQKRKEWEAKKSKVKVANERKLPQTAANCRKLPQKVKVELPEMYGTDKYIKEINKFQQTKKAIIENPDKIIKVKKVVYQKIKVDNYGRSNKFVRKGWDEIMNQIKLKIEYSTI